MAERKKNWKEQTLTIAGKTVQDISFSGGADLLPNYFMINNLSAGDISLGIKIIPSATIYDMKVPSYGQQITARDTPANIIRIYNDSTNPSTIVLTTFTDTFDPSVLASSGSVTVTGGGSGGTSFDGIIKGFTTALPSGNNKIGTVTVDAMPAQTINFSSLPAGNNNIGNVGVVGGVTITSMPAVQVSNTPTRSTHETFETSITNAEYVYDMTARSGINTITYLSNDDTQNDLFVAFDNTVASSTLSPGQNGVIRLKPGEALTDFNRVCQKIRLIRNAGSGLVRFVGV